MSISKRQFDLLQAMGITVWQRRDLPSHSSAVESTQSRQHVENINDSVTSTNEQVSLTPSHATSPQAAANEIIEIDLKVLLKQPLFNDIIICLGASSADLSITQNQIDLGIINWQFTQSDSITFEHNCLKTPDLTTIANSPELKKSLWQSIGPLSAS
jgi:DNA polymerase III psi subunit